MKRLIEQRYVIRHNFLTLIGIFLCAYFTWNAVTGERSIFKLAAVNHQVETVNARLDKVRTQREQLEARVVKLRPGSIDPDLLEERARILLGFAKPGEHIVVLPN